MGLGSGIRNPEKLIPDPGSKGQKGTGSWIRNTVRNQKEPTLLRFGKSFQRDKKMIPLKLKKCYQVRYPA